LKDLEIEKEDILIENIPKGTILLELTAELVQPMTLTQGSLEISSSHIYFTDVQNTMRKTWELDTITKIYGRRYVLRWTALEWFTDYGKNYFLNFSNQKDAIKVFKKIISLSSTIEDSFFANPDKAISKANITTLWTQRKISNFDYLMYLNSMSGRTYNDLAQYPIFPWILSEYSTSTIDLANPSNYRDLSKPIGALNQSRLRQLIERYEAFVDPMIPSFLYGSHYSSPGIVLYFLIRLEPFTTHFLTLQGGYFDYAERLFLSLQNTWSACLTAPADFKELTPEFFYLPEFLTNVNGINLGAKQDGTTIGDVILPPWARDDPRLFVHIQREALESEYVTQHLNEWIDLIFGYKQSGKDAVAASNLFYYLSYEGAADLDSLVDEQEKLSKVSHILNFGQIPSLLFRKPHPKRLSIYDLGIPKQIPSPSFYSIKPRPFSDTNGIPVISIFQVGKDISLIYADGVVSTNHITMQLDKSQPFLFEIDRTVATNKQKEITLLFAPELSTSSQCLGITEDGKTIVHCGCWDDTIKVINFSANQILSCSFDHDKLVNCIDMGVDGRTLVTGSYDTSLRIYDYSDTSKSILGNTRKRGSKLQLKQSLFAHDDKVLCVSLSTQSNTLASSSADNTVNQWSTKGKLLRSLHFEKQVEIVKGRVLVIIFGNL
jgi:WD40 repeat protein